MTTALCPECDRPMHATQSEPSTSGLTEVTWRCRGCGREALEHVPVDTQG